MSTWCLNCSASVLSEVLNTQSAAAAAAEQRLQRLSAAQEDQTRRVSQGLLSRAIASMQGNCTRCHLNTWRVRTARHIERLEAEAKSNALAKRTFVFSPKKADLRKISLAMMAAIKPNQVLCKAISRNSVVCLYTGLNYPCRSMSIHVVY